MAEVLTEPFEPGTLNTVFTGIGRDTGEFDENEAMVLTGKVVRILCFFPGKDVTHVVEDVLLLAGHYRSASVYRRQHGDRCLSYCPVRESPGPDRGACDLSDIVVRFLSGLEQSLSGRAA